MWLRCERVRAEHERLYNEETTRKKSTLAELFIVEDIHQKFGVGDHLRSTFCSLAFFVAMLVFAAVVEFVLLSVHESASGSTNSLLTEQSGCVSLWLQGEGRKRELTPAQTVLVRALTIRCTATPRVAPNEIT